MLDGCLGTCKRFWTKPLQVYNRTPDPSPTFWHACLATKFGVGDGWLDYFLLDNTDEYYGGSLS